MFIFQIKSGYSFKLSLPETKKLLKGQENMSQLEITEVALVFCNLINMTYQYNWKLLHPLMPNE